MALDSGKLHIHLPANFRIAVTLFQILKYHLFCHRQLFCLSGAVVLNGCAETAMAVSSDMLTE